MSFNRIDNLIRLILNLSFRALLLWLIIPTPFCAFVTLFCYLMCLLVLSPSCVEHVYLGCYLAWCFFATLLDVYALITILNTVLIC